MNYIINLLFKMVLAVCAICTLVFAPELVIEVFASSGVIMAATPVAGGSFSIDSTRDDDYLQQDISTLVTDIEPWKYPYSTMLERLPKGEKAKSYKIEFEEYEHYKRGGVVEAYAAGGNAKQLTLTLTSETQMDRFNVDDTMEIQDVEYEIGGVSFTLQGEVISKNGQQIVIENVFTDVNGDIVDYPAHASLQSEVGDGQGIYRIGNSKGEKQAQTTPRGTKPVRNFNYVQHFMFQVEQSVLLQQMESKSGHPTFSANQKRQIQNFRSEVEYAMKRQQRGEKKDVNHDELKWFMGGFSYFVDKRIDYTIGGLSNAEFIEWTRKIFAGNNGSQERVLFADDMLMADILKSPNVEKQLAGQDVKVKWGLMCTEIKTNFGLLNLVYDPSWSEIGVHNYGIVVDPTNVRIREFYPMQIGPLKLKESGQSWVDANVCHYVPSVEYRHVDTHAHIVGSPGE